jgi:hypothetical protein
MTRFLLQATQGGTANLKMATAHNNTGTNITAVFFLRMLVTPSPGIIAVALTELFVEFVLSCNRMNCLQERFLEREPFAE